MVTIYGLVDPETREVRYVGKTANLRKRLYDHLRATDPSYRTHWVQSLVTRGLKPEAFVIDEVPEDEWQEAERFWIAYFERQGCRLTNGADGGLGGSRPGHQMSPEANARRLDALRKAVCGRPVSEESRAKMRAAKLGRVETPEHRANIAAALAGPRAPHYGKALSAEHRARIAASKTGQPGTHHTPETIARISQTQKGRPKSEESKRRMSDGQRNRAPFSPEHRAHLSEATSRYWERVRAASAASIQTKEQ